MNSHTIRRSAALSAALLLLALCFSGIVFAQGGYYLSGNKTLNDTSFTNPSISLPIPTNREDVKAIGMGKTQVANGRDFMAMLYNPALLADSKTTIEVLGVQASLPPETFDAALYLKDHIKEFRDAVSLSATKAAANHLVNTPNLTLQEELADIQAIQNGLKFPNELLNTVIGSAENPKVHGFRILPAVSAQIGNFGLSVYGTVQTGFIISQSPTMSELLQVQIPSNIATQQDLIEAINAAAQIYNILNAVTDPISNTIDINKAYPVAFSVSYIDLVAAGGYGTSLTKSLSVGGAVKVVNRRFSSKIVVANSVDAIWTQARSDFNTSITGVTADLGGTYKFPFGLDVGLSLQNIIPTKTISSTVTAHGVATGYVYDLDQAGNKKLNGNGDTAVLFAAQRQTANIPLELKLPFIMNAGARYAINRQCDVAFDWADIAAQDVRFQTYVERFRLGAEYRLDAIEDVLGITPRLGFADKRPTFGLGLNIFRVVQIDGAYAYDTYVGAKSYYAQLRIGW